MYISRKGLAHIGIYKGNVKEFGVEIEVGLAIKPNEKRVGAYVRTETQIKNNNVLA